MDYKYSEKGEGEKTLGKLGAEGEKEEEGGEEDNILINLLGNFTSSRPNSGKRRTKVGPTPPLQCEITLVPPCYTFNNFMCIDFLEELRKEHKEPGSIIREGKKKGTSKEEQKGYLNIS